MIAYKGFIIVAALAILQAMYLALVNSEVKRDYAAMMKDGSRNSLGLAWHRKSWLKILAISSAMVIPFFALSWQIAAALLFVEGMEFWLLFDRRLNRARGLDSLYVGKNNSLDLFFGKLFRKAPGRAMLLFKIAGLVVGVALLAWFLWRYFANN